MPRAPKSSTLLWLSVVCCFIASLASGSMMRVDAYADMWFVVASDSVVVFFKRVSGASDELLALSAKDGSLLWRDRAEWARSDGVVGTDDSLFLIAKDQLQKRLLSSGKLLWQLPLDKIPEQKTPPRFTFERAREKVLGLVGLGTGAPASMAIRFGSGKPDYYDYQALALAGGKIFVSREAMAGVGCVSSACFNDWLVIDVADGKFNSGGSGQLVGRAGQSWLMKDREGFVLFRDGRVRLVTGLDTSAECSLRSSCFFGSEGDKLSMGERCLFESDDQNGTAISIFDSRKATVKSFAVPQTHTNEQSSWVLTASNVLRYAQCTRTWGDEGARLKSQPWFDLYDFDGHPLRSAAIDLATPCDDYWVKYAGRLTNGILFELDEAFYLVEVPSLRIIRTSAPEGRRPDKSWCQALVHGNFLYRIDGNLTVPEMTEDELPHEFTVDCATATSQQKLWHHVERVKLRKIPAN